MKIRNVVGLIIIASAVMVSSCKNGMMGSDNIKSTGDSVSYCLGVVYGNMLQEAEIENFNPALLAKAMSDVMKKEKTKFTTEDANKFLQTYFMALQGRMAEKAIKEGQAFLDENKKKSSVKTTASGLQYEVITEGTGPSPKETETVTVHYKGTLIDGTVFDSSLERNEPAQFPVNQVIKGWQEALQLMKVGGKFKVVIPSDLGYGPQPPRGSKIKPNSVLIFEMELLGIGAPAPAANQPQVKIK